MPQHEPKQSQVTDALMRAIITPYILSPKQRLLMRITIANLVLTVLCNCLLPPCLLSWFPRYGALLSIITLSITILEIILLILVVYSQRPQERAPWIDTERETEAIFKISGTTGRHKAIARIRTQEVTQEQTRVATAFLEHPTRRVTGVRDHAILAASNPFRVRER